MVPTCWTASGKSAILMAEGGRTVEIEVKLDPQCAGVRVEIHAPAMTPEVEAVLKRLEEPETLLGFREGTAVPLTAAQILRFYGEDKAVLAQTETGVYAVRQRLYELEQNFSARRFARISHSEIVNLKKVTALDLTLTGTIRVTLSDGTVCWASRRYVRRIKEVLGL